MVGESWLQNLVYPAAFSLPVVSPSSVALIVEGSHERYLTFTGCPFRKLT